MVSMPSDSGVTSSSSLILHVARQNAGLHRRAQRDHFVGIQLGVRALARNSFSTAERTSGMRVDPPTITTSSICFDS